MDRPRAEYLIARGIDKIDRCPAPLRIDGHAEMVTALRKALAVALSQKLADLHEEINAFDATFSRHEAERILAGLGFREADLTRGLGRLSGWRLPVLVRRSTRKHGRQ